MLNKYFPNKFYHNIYEIDYDELKKNNINTLFFDVDNTIIRRDEKYFSKKLYTFLKNLEKDFNIVIISNNKKDRIKTACNNEFKFIYSAMKPLKKGFKKALSINNSNPKNTAMIGDQLLTDIKGANKMNIYSILVNPISPSSEKIGSRFNRFFESRVLNKIKRKHKLEFENLLTIFYYMRKFNDIK